MFLTGPDVIRSVTGEEIDFENLGGAGVHLGISGLAHLTAPSEQEALALVRSVLGYLPSNNMENPPQREYSGPAADREEALNSIIPADPSAAYSMREVIDRVVDPGSLIELQPTFARNAIVGLARIAGMPVGIVANEPAVVAGVMDIDSSDKITRFVRFCDAFNVPLVTFVDTPGFLPGVDQEHRGIIRHGAKVLYAYSEATVPKISVVTRKAYGGAYIVMSSRSLDGDLAFGWPSAEIAVMGPEGAVNILYRKQIAEAEDKAAERSRLVQEYRTNLLNPYRAASLGYLDDVIEPAETRARIVAGLKALRDKQVTPLPRKHGNMPV